MEQNKQSPARNAAVENYAAMVRRLTPKSKLGQGCLRAFWVGGIICMAGQAVADLSTLWFHLPANAALTMGSVFLVFLTALLTGIGVFDKIAQYAGAGTVVPITGFANAMVSPAMEFKPEGWVLGTGARLFTIAGPVLVYGISASVVVGILYYFIRW
ncbi:MAG: stage V sporulation protein AC [Eubacteriales bacterium]|nr:stage V sporulation protein AC [Eubacteriales bacterium]